MAGSVIFGVTFFDLPFVVSSINKPIAKREKELRRARSSP